MEMLLKMELFANRHCNYATAWKRSFVSWHINFPVTCLLCCVTRQLWWIAIHNFFAVVIGNLFSPFLSSECHHMLSAKKGPRKEQQRLIHGCQRLLLLSMPQMQSRVFYNSVRTHLVIIRICHVKYIPFLVPGYSKWVLKLCIDSYSINITKSK